MFPAYRGELEYVCLSCGHRFGIGELLYTCPDCGHVLLLEDRHFPELKRQGDGAYWRGVFDGRTTAGETALRGIFRFYEVMAPVLDAEDIVYLGEGNTPIVSASAGLRDRLKAEFMFKNDGQNPSASFKDRGMACAFSYLRYLARTNKWDEVLGVCASTGDTSAAAAMYGAYVGRPVKTAVLLPQGKVTPQQLSQPLGSGARVLEIPGVFDDCMKIVEYLADHYRVALLNSKNSWRILGQESYAYEVAQWFGWDVADVTLFVPIGNAGNISAIMSGFLKLHELGVISAVPRLFGVQSEHADPVWRYYSAPKGSRRYEPVTVRPSVAQAAMIGNPVSFPRVRFLEERYDAIRPGAFGVVQVTEQEIMEATVTANRYGHIACTQGGECLAGLLRARESGLVGPHDLAVLDSTAHALKFSGFTERYFNDDLPEYGIACDASLANRPVRILDDAAKASMDAESFTRKASGLIAERLGLRKI